MVVRMKLLTQRTHMFLLFAAYLLLPDMTECMDPSIENQQNLPKQRRVEGFVLSRMNAEHQDCVDDIYASDIDDNLKLSEEEYAEFISTRSRGAIDVDAYAELPFPLISTFVYGSCFCSFVLNVPNCCVGPGASIELDPNQSVYIENNLITVCRTVDEAIVGLIGTFDPTTSPTSTPTLSPTDFPTMKPSMKPSIDPTSEASGMPSLVPTSTPSQAQSNVPTGSPTVASSDPPTLVTTNAPTVSISAAPSTSTSNDIETPEPTPEDLACINFQYGIENNGGFTSDDIENEVNNTFKAGLLIATEIVTIEALNTTRRNLADLNFQNHEFLDYFQIVDIDEFGDFSPSRKSSEGARQTLSVIDSKSLSSRIENSNDRRLAFYSDTNPPVINNIFDNPYCPASGSGVICSIVDTSVCVKLEEGDDRDEVREGLLDDIETAFRDGSFESAIPSEI